MIIPKKIIGITAVISNFRSPDVILVHVRVIYGGRGRTLLITSNSLFQTKFSSIKEGCKLNYMILNHKFISVFNVSNDTMNQYLNKYHLIQFIYNSIRVFC